MHREQGRGNREQSDLNQSKGEREMKKILIATTIAALVSGCYSGKAAFQGEDMKISPFFGPSATCAADTASEGHATNQ